MYLERLYIKNYRSIKELDLIFSKGKNVIIGRNNTGKSNIIKALNLLLGQNSPTYVKSSNITYNDFYSWKESIENVTTVQTTDDLLIWCELRRDNDEILDYDEIYKCYGFYIYSQTVGWEYKSPIKEPIRIPKDQLPINYGQIFELNEDIDISDKEYINPKNRSNSVLERQFDNKFSFAFAFRATKDEHGNISKNIRFLYREGISDDWILAFKAPIRNELIQSAILPSFRDPQNQLRITDWTWFGKLMHHLTINHSHSTELKAALDRINSIALNIFADIKNNIEKSSLDVAFPGTELHFQFNADTKTDLYKDCLIYIDDGFKSQLTEKGSGIQSATIIGLFNYYTRFVNTITSGLLCIEEPEIYLHPHARRVISDRLDDFLDNNKNQVILTTHSVEFIRSGSDINVILVHKGKEGSKAMPIKIKDFKHLLINNNQNELFFADKVIVCEGYDEFILRAVSKEIFPKKLDEQNVSIVEVGGRIKLAILVSLVLKLGIKCFIFTDFDYVLRDKMEERKKYDAKAHECILNISQDFFTQKCIFGDNGKGAILEIQKKRELMKKNYENQFYTAKKATDIPESSLPEYLRSLRKNGVGILSGEIENCSKNTSFMSPENKLDLNKIYALNERLASETKIIDLFDTSEIKEFLDVVFSR